MSDDYGNGNIAALFGGQPFDPNAHEPSKDFEVLPPGNYTCLIEDAELKTTKAGNGQFIKVTLRVAEETFAKNRKLFDNINVQNPSEECQRMGIAQLSSLGRAAQCYPVSDTADLKDKVVVAVVKVSKRKDTGEDQNTIRTYEVNPGVYVTGMTAPAGYVPPVAPSQVATAPAPQPASAPPAPTAGAAMPSGTPSEAPWKR